MTPAGYDTPHNSTYKFQVIKLLMCIKFAVITLYYPISSNVMAIRFDGTFYLQGLLNYLNNFLRPDTKMLTRANKTRMTSI